MKLERKWEEGGAAMDVVGRHVEISSAADKRFDNVCHYGSAEHLMIFPTSLFDSTEV